jgi:transcriptional regulator with XRE-family HTH domain
MVATMARRRQPEGKPVHPLKQWREAQELSQDALAAQLGVKQGMISHIEMYRRDPSTKMLRQLCELTGLPPDAFLQPEQFVREHPDVLNPRRRKP